MKKYIGFSIVFILLLSSCSSQTQVKRANEAEKLAHQAKMQAEIQKQMAEEAKMQALKQVELLQEELRKCKEGK